MGGAEGGGVPHAVFEFEVRVFVHLLQVCSMLCVYFCVCARVCARVCVC